MLIAAELGGVASTLDDVIESILGKDLITLVRNKKRDSLKQAPLYLFRLDLQERLRSRHSTSVAVAEAAARVDRSGHLLPSSSHHPFAPKIEHSIIGDLDFRKRGVSGRER